MNKEKFEKIEDLVEDHSSLDVQFSVYRLSVNRFSLLCGVNPDMGMQNNRAEDWFYDLLQELEYGFDLRVQAAGWSDDYSLDAVLIG